MSAHNCRHGAVEDLTPGTIIHTHSAHGEHGFAKEPDHAVYDRWLIYGVMTTGPLLVRWIHSPESKLPVWAQQEGTLRATDLESRLANDNVRIEVAE